MDFTLESTYRAQGYSVICGVDEAGRGPLCGPVCAAACILPDGLLIEGLNDSKKLSEKKREALYAVITERALSWCVAYASVEEIDTLNILNADMLAMRRAVEGLSLRCDCALVDGNIARDFPIPAFPIIKGDAKSPSIAAASILAKVSRDRLCVELDRQYPGYGIAGHKGYGTPAHIRALRELGPSPCHRRSFLHFLDKPE